MTRTKRGSPTKQIRIPEHLLAQYEKFCGEKGVSLSEFLRYGGNLIITRPELWVDFNAGKEEDNPSIANQKLLTELKEIIVGQEQKIDSMSIELGQLSMAEQIREAEDAKEVLKDHVLELVSQKPLSLNEIREQITEGWLQKHLFPPDEKMISVLDQVLTNLIREELIKFNKKTKTYSSFFS